MIVITYIWISHFVLPCYVLHLYQRLGIAFLHNIRANLRAGHVVTALRLARVTTQLSWRMSQLATENGAHVVLGTVTRAIGDGMKRQIAGS